MKIFFFLCCLLGIINLSKGQQLTNRGQNFYIAFPEVFDNLNASFTLHISCEQFATGNVEITGTGFTESFTVIPGVVTTVTLPSSDAHIGTSEVILERAIHLTSDIPVAVFASTSGEARTEVAACLPLPSLGSDYMVTTYPNVMKNGVWYDCNFIVVAGAQPCAITIVPSCNTEGGVSAGTPINVNLQPNEVYMVQAETGAANDLTGTTVTANNGSDKFTLFNGHHWAYISSCPTLHGDPMYEIAYPTTSWGSEYILVITQEQNENVYRITANQDGTTFTVNGAAPTGSLNAGETYQGSFSDTTEAIMIESNNPVAVVQFMTTGVCAGNGDPSMVIANSNEQMFLDSMTFYADSIGSGFIQNNYVNVITRSDDTSTVQLNGTLITGWTLLPYNNNYSYRLLPTSAGSHTLTTTGCGILAYAYGVGIPESYFYSAGVRINSVENSITYTNANNGLPGLCGLDSILFIPHTSGGIVTTYDWDFGDGNTSTEESPIHAYANAGTYNVSLIVTYNCFEPDTLRDTLQVSDYVDVYAEIQSDSIFCPGDTVDFLVSTNAQNGQYNYFWYVNQSLEGTSNTFSHSINDTSEVTVELVHIGSCPIVTDSVRTGPIILPLENVFATAVPDTICKDSSSYLQAIINDTTNISSFWWNVPGLNGLGIHEIYPNSTTDYIVTIENVCGYQQSDTIQVNIFQSPIEQILVDFIGCDSVSANFDYTYNNGYNYTFEDAYWNIGGAQYSEQNPTIIYSSPLFEDVNLYLEFSNGCTFELDSTIVITVNHKPDGDFYFNPEPAIAGEKVEFIDISNGNIQDWEWYVEDDFISALKRPIYIFDEGEYQVTQIVFDENGCTDTTTHPIEIEGIYTVYVPNAFTPDGNDVNNEFKPVFTNIDPYTYHFMVFNKWGETLFESHDQEVGWSGTYGNRGLVNEGVYIWKIQITDNLGIKHEFKGHVTLLK